jgi:transglutaminase-like putative cysteine protease
VIYTIRHRTTYAYESRVTFARCVLRLTPVSSPGQTVIETAVTMTPPPSRASERPGPFGEPTRTVVIETPHRSLTIEARSRVELHAGAERLDFGSPWEEVRLQGLETGDLGAEGPAHFIYPTPRSPTAPAITDYARESFAAGRGVVEAATDLMNRIKADFTFDARATDVSTPPGEAFAARRGVCQDFAHIMICGLRGLSLPARYVSGYLRTHPPPGRPRLAGADATHAWVSLWCGPEAGWIGFDPTNAVMARDDHIVLACGRDYSDVAPIDGIILSPGRQTLTVEVDVVPDDELEPEDPKLIRPDFGAKTGGAGVA